MAPPRVVGLDLAIGFSVLGLCGVEITGAANSWSHSPGLYTHLIFDELFVAAFLFFSGLRSNFIYSNIISDGPKQFRYLMSRSIACLILGVIFFFLNDSIFLLHLSLLLFFCLVLAQLNSTILYFLAFTMIMLALILPLSVSSSPDEAAEASAWWSDILYLRNDSFVSLAMYFFFGMIYGRSDFVNPKWQRFTRILSLLVLVATLLTHFASMDYFQSSYFLEGDGVSRLFPASPWIYRPIYLLGSVPAIILILHLMTFLAERYRDSKILRGLNKAGTIHMTIITIGLLIAAIVNILRIETIGFSRSIAWGFIIISWIILSGLYKQIRTGPVEWLIQRFY